MKKLLLLMVCTLVFTCSKDDNSSEEPQNSNLEGGTIYTSQIVEIKTSNVSAETYNATLGDLDIQAQRASDSVVAFLVPRNFNLGSTTLKIESLNNLTVNYNVEETTLSNTPENTITPFFDYFEAYTLSVQNTPNYNLVNSYNTQLVDLFNNASDAEKELMAKHYKANKVRFDYVFTTDFTSRQIADSNRAVLTKFGIATLACGVSTAIAILDPEPFTKAISTGIAIVSWFSASDFKTDFKNRNVKTLDVIFDSVEGQFDLINSSISFNSESVKSISVSSNFRTIKQSDSQDTNGNVANFFTKNNIYTGFTTQINEAITFVNDNIFFSNISLLQDTFLNTTDVAEPKVIDAEFINNFSFSLSNSNLTIVSSAFNNGNLEMQIDVVDETVVNNGVETGTLNFTYQDDFNNISGTFDIEVNTELDILGLWELLLTDCTGTSSDCSLIDGPITFNENGTVHMSDFDDPDITVTQNQYTFINNNIVVNIEFTEALQPYVCNGNSYNASNQVSITYNLNKVSENEFTGIENNISTIIDDPSCDSPYTGETISENITLVRL